MMKLFILLLLVVLVTPLSVFAEEKVYDLQLDSVTSSYDNSTNRWTVHIEGSNFYPNYNIDYIYVVEKTWLFSDYERNVQTDEYGNFVVDVDMNYGYIESGESVISVLYESKIYEFVEYIEFGDYPEDIIEWQINTTNTKEGKETLVEISGVVNFEENIIDGDYGHVKIHNPSTGNYYFYENTKRDNDGNFHVADTITNPLAGEYEIVVYYDGLARYGIYIVEPYTIPPDPTQPESRIQFQTDKLTYYQDEKVIVNGTIKDVDWSESLDISYKIYENGNVIFIDDSPQNNILDDTGNFELTIPLDIDHTGIFDITITIQDASNSVSIMYINTPNMENETLYNHIMENKDKIKENESSIILLEDRIDSILIEIKEWLRDTTRMFR